MKRDPHLPQSEDSELNLPRKVLAEAEKAEHSAIATIGVFATAAVIMVSQVFNLAYLPDETGEDTTP